MLLRFAVPVLGLTWAAQLTFVAAGWPIVPALVLELVILVGVAVRLTDRDHDHAGVRALFAQALRWCIAPSWYAVALLA